MIIVNTIQSRPYFLDTIHSIQQNNLNGLGRLIVLSDGLLDRDVDHWEVIQSEKIGRRNIGWKALRIALAAQEDLLFFEDDILVCDDGPQIMFNAKIPDRVSFLSFFHTTPPGDFRNKHINKPRIKLIDANKWLFSQAIKIPLDIIELLCNENYNKVAQDLLPNGFDAAIGAIISKTNKPKVGIVWPNLIEHVGKQSIVSRNFPMPRSLWYLDQTQTLTGLVEGTLDIEI